MSKSLNDHGEEARVRKAQKHGDTLHKALMEKRKADGRERSAARTSARRRLARFAFAYRFDLDRMTSLCTLIASGLSAPTACKKLHLSERTLFYWIAIEKAAFTMYEVACQARADARAEEVVVIADRSKDAKLRIDARKWDAARQKPHKYGDKVQHSHGGTVSLISLLIGAKQLAREMVERGELPALPGSSKPVLK